MTTPARRLSRFAGPAVGVALLVAACGGAAPATGSPTDAPAPTDAAAPTDGAPTSAPATQGGGSVDLGSGSVEVTLTGGPDAGTYTGSDNPNCTEGLVGPGGWGVQYSTAEAGAGQLSSFQLILHADGTADSPDVFMPGIELQTTVTIGELFAGNDYEVKVMSAASGQPSSGEGSATIDDKGDTATIRVTGTTADGVAIDATVECPTVTRMGG